MTRRRASARRVSGPGRSCAQRSRNACPARRSAIGVPSRSRPRRQLSSQRLSAHRATRSSTPCVTRSAASRTRNQLSPRYRHRGVCSPSGSGIWVVQNDGSKRLLAGYRDAAWSPHGLYVAAVHGNELRALEPNGQLTGRLGARGGSATHVGRSTDSESRISQAALSESSTATAPGTGCSPATFNPDQQRGSRTHTPLRTSTKPGTSRSRTSTNRTATRPRRPARHHVNSPGQTTGRHSSPSSRMPSKSSRSVAHGSAVSRGIAQVSAAAISPNGKRIAFVETRSGRSTLQLTGVLGGPTAPILEERALSRTSTGRPTVVGCCSIGAVPTSGCSSTPRWVLAVSNVRAEASAPIPGRRLVLSVTACYGQFVPGDKEVEEMTIELASARRATRLVG